MSRIEKLKSHGSFRRCRRSGYDWQNTDYHVLYTTLTFQAGPTATFICGLEIFSIIKPVLTLIII